ncbi:hypothetical protein SAMN04487895_101510 [Paenibacillus sophorae]|uniref:Uncharacterized protein n=1 Tax=Paenibacillus sophorae TaxID=1333845 RepID=A0A1H8GGT7_9BACL|nr:hypothetical protein [Paenibacillus sophorae]QWU14220.1 hypothetical protein KP014_20120 [Paenibacillus sophorae]SEN43193.1 hypothetical protein SAMN04487895_101510 [Paenibacillus sophorae]
MKINNRVGEKHFTNEGYEIQIVDYINRHTVLIKFVDVPDYLVWVTAQNVSNGEIKNPFHKSVYGVGYYGCGSYSARVNNIKTPQYIKWFSMFNRCYDVNYQKDNPRYIGCTVSDEFHNYQNFAKWYDKKIYPCSYKLELDKDLLVEGNKTYSPSTCCFLPKELNAALNSKRNDREFMTVLYNKYKSEVPFYIKEKLFKLINTPKRSEQ